MAGLEPLIAHIYHEKQAPGSMLCAQHALNALLQGNYFTAPDLSAIAASVDQMEDAFQEGRTGTSTNMDDTGFFSVQVLDQALSVWGLRIPRWRSEEMQPYQDHPQNQLAFILNYEQHWYTLRRFGEMSTQPGANPGQGHWFNLNSSLDSPEWISKTYLGMVLQQAEQDGYSVFVVTQLDPSEPLALPRTDADEIASTLPEPTSSGARIRAQQQQSPVIPDLEDFADEDMELQRALQASLMGGDADFHHHPVLGHVDVPSPGISRPLSPLHIPGGMPSGVTTDSDSSDPVAASRERNRQMLERMRMEQQWVHQNLQGSGHDEAAARRRKQREDEEEEMLQRAIAESEAMAQASSSRQSSGTRVGEKSTDYDGEDTDTDTEMDDDIPPVPKEPNHRRLVPLPTTSYNHLNRVYDDDDAELQAALRASLDQMPEGFVMPELSQQPKPIPESSIPVPSAHSSAAQAKSSEPREADEVPDVPSSPPPPEQVSMDEIRRRRLARFGG
jgi:ataxin-3